MNTRVHASLAALHRLARLEGVLTGYLDMNREPRTAAPESLLAVLRALGVPIERVDQAPDALRHARHLRATRPLEPVHVAWEGQPAAIPVRLPARPTPRALDCRWELEDGTVQRRRLHPGRLPEQGAPRPAGGPFTTRLVPVPRDLPAGYHRLTLETGRDRLETRVFCAPESCFQPDPPRRRWGVFAPLYALHSARSWGAGNLGDLADLVAWTGEQGGGVVSTLPLLPAFLHSPCEPSPYSPVSRLFWNEFYLDLGRVPEIASCAAARRLLESAGFRRQLRRLRAAPLVDYAAQMALQRQVLGLLSRSFFARPSPRREALQRFLREHPAVADYARFRATQERLASPWALWPERLRDGELRDDDSPAALRQYHLYVQWLAHEQMANLSAEARNRQVDLYLDVPLGTHRDGFDTWRHRSEFALDASGGAPPDPVFTRGQDWGFPPMHPQRSRERGHDYFRAYLGHHLRHARMLRFDHVMSLHRLYWVPSGLPATHGAYVRYPAEELYAILSIESHRHRAAIIGEDLGTVPAEVHRGLRRHGVHGMFVVQYETQPRPPALRRVPTAVVASLNTHDMPMFAAFWAGLDIADRRDLGLLRAGREPAERRVRERMRRALARLLRQEGLLRSGPPDPAAVSRAVTAHLGASTARWVLVNLEDLWLEAAPQNTPGTSTERVNWRRRMRFALEDLKQRSEVRETLRALDRTRPSPWEPV